MQTSIVLLNIPSFGLSTHKKPRSISCFCSSAISGTIGTTNVERYFNGQLLRLIIFSKNVMGFLGCHPCFNRVFL